MDGVSMLYSFGDSKAAGTRRTQYFEIFGNRGLYHDGWLAHTIHKAPWEGKPKGPFLEDKWELYHVAEDFSSANDVAAKNPEKLKELQDLFLKEAEKNHALPLDDRLLERFNASLVGRPDLMDGRTSLTVFEGMIGMTENVFINIKNRSHTITADVQVPKGGANGVIISQAGRFGGWSLYVKDGKPMYTYNFLGLEQFTVAADEALAPGAAEVVLDFAYDGGGLGKGGDATLSVNGAEVASGRIGRTQPLIFSADETADVGLDNQTPVVDGIGIGRDETRFTGTIDKVLVELR
jgi:hypothetical protein